MKVGADEKIGFGAKGYSMAVERALTDMAKFPSRPES